MIEEMETEWEPPPNSFAMTSFGCQGKTYTISTVQLSGAPMPFFTSFVTAMGDALNNNSDETEMDYETMLFIDGESNGSNVYPFGDMPGNDMQGVYERYWTEDEAKEGHVQFVERVKQILTAESEVSTTQSK